MRASLYLRPEDALQIQKCILWEALCIKMHDFCVNVIPALESEIVCGNYS